MTNAIEVTKREMYDALAILKGRIEINYSIKDMQRGSDEFESALEDHLEALRKQIKQMAAESSELLENIKIIDQHHRSLTEERDNLRNRLQAFEFANKSSGEFLIEAQELLRSEREVMAHLQAKVKSQRQSIGQLKNDRNNAQALAAVNYQKYQKARQELSELRKSLMATPTQDSKENAKKDASEAYNLGYSSAMGPNPYAKGSVSHIHWNSGFQERYTSQNMGFGGPICGVVKP